MPSKDHLTGMMLPLCLPSPTFDFNTRITDDPLPINLESMKIQSENKMLTVFVTNRIPLAMKRICML